MGKRDRPVFNFAHAEQKKFMRNYINTLDGLYWVDIEKCKDQRSLNQNSYLHGVVFPRIAARLQQAWGHPVDAKEFLKERFLKVAVCDAQGEVVGHVVRGTHDLDVEECSLFIEQCIQFAGEYLDYHNIPPASHYETVLT